MNGIGILKKLLSDEVKIHLISITVFFGVLKLWRQGLDDFLNVFLWYWFAEPMTYRNNVRSGVFYQVTEVLWLGKAMRSKSDGCLADIEKRQQLFLFLFWYFSAQSFIINKLWIFWRVLFVYQKHITVKVFDVLSRVELLFFLKIWCLWWATFLSFDNNFFFKSFWVWPSVGIGEKLILLYFFEFLFVFLWGFLQLGEDTLEFRRAFLLFALLQQLDNFFPFLKFHLLNLTD